MMCSNIFLVIFIICVSLNGILASLEVLDKDDDSAARKCSEKKCFPKCCGKGEYLRFMEKKCVYSEKQYKNIKDLNVYKYRGYKTPEITDKTLGDIWDFLVPGKMEKVIDNIPFKNKTLYVFEQYNFHSYLTENDGVYYVTADYTAKKAVDSCVDNVLLEDGNAEVRLVVVPPKPKTCSSADFLYLYYCSIISSVFLVLVLLVYIILPEQRTFGGMILMAYMASLLMGFIFVAIRHSPNSNRHSSNTCILITAGIYFSFLSTFCWMNVMSLDIFWTFRGYAKARPIHRKGKRFKFFLYSLYAWGLPALMSVALVVINHYQDYLQQYIVTPRIPSRGCFLDAPARYRYLFIPMGTLIAANWMFFLLTIYNIKRRMRGTEILSTNSAAVGNPVAHRHQKNRLKIYLKLSVIMGINWLLDLGIAKLIDMWCELTHIWAILEIYNALFGVIIFVLFVCKKKIYSRLIIRFSEFRAFLFDRQNLAQSSRSRSRTSDSNYPKTSEVSTIPQLDLGSSDLKKTQL